MNLATIIGLMGISLLLSASLLRTLLFFKLNRQYSYLAAALLFVVSFITFSGDSINLYIRGIFNDLSITTLILLTYYVIRPDGNRKQNLPVFFIVLITGVLFYPMALGLGPVDPYSWGFINKDHGFSPPLLFLGLLAGLMVFAWFKNFNLLLLSLALSTLAYQTELLESRNLWDYLLDPLIFIYALITILSYLFRNKKLTPFI